jgi:phosphohistidine phosphatase SixA
MRHARAPGTGDPPGFRLGACETQRNLDETGRRQAADIGRALREAGVLVTQVRSSRWCRASETAALAFPGVPTIPDAALDSFFGDEASAKRQTRHARALITGWTGRQGVLALVSHGVNIEALTGTGPAEGEIVVLFPRREIFDVVGRWRGA